MMFLDRQIFGQSKNVLFKYSFMLI